MRTPATDSLNHATKICWLKIHLTRETDNQKMIITESLANKRNQKLILCNAQKSQNKKTKENIDFLTGKTPGKST